MKGLLEQMAERIRIEPVAVMAVVQAVIGLFTAFGLEWTADQVAAVLTVTAAILALITRQKVTPHP